MNNVAILKVGVRLLDLYPKLTVFKIFIISYWFDWLLKLLILTHIFYPLFLLLVGYEINHGIDRLAKTSWLVQVSYQKQPIGKPHLPTSSQQPSSCVLKKLPQEHIHPAYWISERGGAAREIRVVRGDPCEFRGQERGIVGGDLHSGESIVVFVKNQHWCSDHQYVQQNTDELKNKKETFPFAAHQGTLHYSCGRWPIIQKDDQQNGQLTCQTAPARWPSLQFS